MAPILYNVTIKIDAEVEEAWLDWMRAVHLPDVMKTGCFADHALFRLTYPREDDDGVTYAVQYFCESMELLQRYHGVYAPALQKEHSDKFADRFVAFRTILEKV